MAINSLKTGKTSGINGIFFFIWPTCNLLVYKVFNEILTSGNLPLIFKRSKIIAIVKPGKLANEAVSYRPIAFLCKCYKLLERLIYNRIMPIIKQHVPIEETDFKPNCSCYDQVLSLTNFIEGGFEKCLKIATTFIDLSSAYDIVWRKGLLLKFRWIISCQT